MNERPVGAFAVAERTSRRTTLIVGAGLVSYFVGSLMTAGATLRLAPLLSTIESEPLLWLLTGVLQFLWVLLCLPVAGWLAGRFLEIKPWRFALPAALSALLFDVLLIWALSGAQALFVDWADTLQRAVLWCVGVALTMLAVARGARAHERALASAKALASANGAEYQAFTERQSDKDEGR